MARNECTIILPLASSYRNVAVSINARRVSRSTLTPAFFHDFSSAASPAHDASSLASSSTADVIDTPPRRAFLRFRAVRFRRWVILHTMRASPGVVS